MLTIPKVEGDSMILSIRVSCFSLREAFPDSANPLLSSLVKTVQLCQENAIIIAI